MKRRLQPKREKKSIINETKGKYKIIFFSRSLVSTLKQRDKDEQRVECFNFLYDNEDNFLYNYTTQKRFLLALNERNINVNIAKFIYMH